MKYTSYMKTRVGKLPKAVAVGLVAFVVWGFCFYFFYASPRRVTPILMYHSISEGVDGSLRVTPENFVKQMSFLSGEGYSVISLDSLVEEIKKGRTYLPRTVAITFDDGYEDNFICAFPVLVKYKMAATVFLVTNRIGKEKGYLSWDQVILMRQNGIKPGGHTRNHVYLPSVEDEKILFDEIRGSKEDIETNTGGDANLFCYPTGGFNERIKEIVKNSGYRAACTTNRGSDGLNRDIYELKRVKATNSDMNKPFHFRAKLSGFYNLFRRHREGY